MITSWCYRCYRKDRLENQYIAEVFLCFPVNQLGFILLLLPSSSLSSSNYASYAESALQRSAADHLWPLPQQGWPCDLCVFGSLRWTSNDSHILFTSLTAMSQCTTETTAPHVSLCWRAWSLWARNVSFSPAASNLTVCWQLIWVTFSMCVAYLNPVVCFIFCVSTLMPLTVSLASRCSVFDDLWHYSEVGCSVWRHLYLACPDLYCCCHQFNKLSSCV